MNSANYQDHSESSFEWLTNFKSLAPFLHPSFLFPSVNPSVFSYNRNVKVDPNSIPNKRVLHIGCGTSTLGMELQGTFPFYNYVLNVDNDCKTLLQVSKRWEEICHEHHSEYDSTSTPKCCFGYLDLKVDLTTTQDTSPVEYDSTFINFENTSQIPTQTFDLILDKSTLDCLLCSDNGTCGLLSKVYYHLKPGGIYFVVTFHHMDFILPLIRDCPGLEWSDIKHYRVERRVDSPQVVSKLENNLYRHDFDEIWKDIENMDHSYAQDQSQSSISCESIFDGPTFHSSAWSSGSFEPSEEYRKYVTVFICRRKIEQDCDISSFASTATLTAFDCDAVTRHVQSCNNSYFQQNNPLVTNIRREQLRQKFVHELELVHSSSNTTLNLHMDSTKSLDYETFLSKGKLPIERVYHVLFTNYERSEYDYNDFLLDWSDFQKNGQRSTMSKDDDAGVSFETALSFLEMMQ